MILFWFFFSTLVQAEPSGASHNLLEARLNKIPGVEGREIRYGFDLLTNTPFYYGPEGKIAKNKNARMSCSNCHMEVGTQEFGNSWINTHFNYPQYRAREGEVQTLPERINVCFMHPTQATPIPENSREMKSILLYMAWIGKGRKSPASDNDDRLLKLTFLNRAADLVRGKVVYENNRCWSCHGNNGEGRLSRDNNSYFYPPLWGNGSYVMGSSMSRVSVLARFLKGNMPFGTAPSKPVLSSEDAWDLAAFINAQDRPSWNGNKMPFPSLDNKPFDYPIGPYSDNFSDHQHKFGPFDPIFKYWKEKNKIMTSSTGI